MSDHLLKVKEHFDSLAPTYDYWKKRNWYYYKYIRDFYKTHIPAGKAVLDLGCGTGEVLHCVAPLRGVGIDVSEQMVAIAKKKFPALEFRASAVEKATAGCEPFDYVIMSDLLDHVADIGEIVQACSRLTQQDSRLVIVTGNPRLYGVLKVIEKLGMKMPEGPHQFVSRKKVIKLLQSGGYTIEKEGAFFLLPKYIPFVSNFCNRYLARLPLLKSFCFAQFIIARNLQEKTDHS